MLFFDTPKEKLRMFYVVYVTTIIIYIVYFYEKTRKYTNYDGFLKDVELRRNEVYKNYFNNTNQDPENNTIEISNNTTFFDNPLTRQFKKVKVIFTDIIDFIQYIVFKFSNMTDSEYLVTYLFFMFGSLLQLLLSFVYPSANSNLTYIKLYESFYFYLQYFYFFSVFIITGLSIILILIKLPYLLRTLFVVIISIILFFIFILTIFYVFCLNDTMFKNIEKSIGPSSDLSLSIFTNIIFTCLGIIGVLFIIFLLVFFSDKLINNILIRNLLIIASVLFMLWTIYKNSETPEVKTSIKMYPLILLKCFVQSYESNTAIVKAFIIIQVLCILLYAFISYLFSVKTSNTGNIIFSEINYLNSVSHYSVPKLYNDHPISLLNIFTLFNYQEDIMPKAYNYATSFFDNPDEGEPTMTGYNDDLKEKRVETLYNYTVSFWLKISSNNENSYNSDIDIINYGNGNPLITYNPYSNYLSVSTDSKTIKYNNLDLDKWNYVVVIYSNKKTMDLFVNTKLVGSLINVLSSLKDNSGIKIGNKNKKINGKICNFRHLNTKITLEEQDYIYYSLKNNNLPIEK